MNLLGKGVPMALIGSEGDYYVDTLTNFAYGPKTSEGWGDKKPLASILDNLDEAAPDQPESAPTPDTTNVIESTPIQKLDAKIAELEADGGELYAAAIDVLKFERDKLVADAEARAAQVQNTVQEAIEEVDDGAKKAEEDVVSFWKKNKNDIINYTIIALLAISAAKSLGVL